MNHNVRQQNFDAALTDRRLLRPTRKEKTVLRLMPIRCFL
jgi:hypothetical protein